MGGKKENKRNAACFIFNFSDFFNFTDFWGFSLDGLTVLVGQSGRRGADSGDRFEVGVLDEAIATESRLTREEDAGRVDLVPHLLHLKRSSPCPLSPSRRWSRRSSSPSGAGRWPP